MHCETCGTSTQKIYYDAGSIAHPYCDDHQPFATPGFNAPRCYHPHLAHGQCPAGHGIHLDVDHYETPRWVHCLIVDLVQCPHDMEDVTGAALPGKHRAQS